VRQFSFRFLFPTHCHAPEVNGQSNVVVSKSTDKRSTHFDAKLLQITGTAFVALGDEAKRQTISPLFTKP